MSAETTTGRMIRIILLLITFLSFDAVAQDHPAKQSLGLKAGVNFTFLNLPKSFDARNHTGFMVGGYFSPRSFSRFGFRSELLFSRQGYDYQHNRQTGSVLLNYLMLPQLTTFNITHFFQLQAGGQIAILVKTKVDSSASPSSLPATPNNNDYFNKLNYGLAGGLEIKPFAGLFVGARYNLFFNLFNDASSSPATVPSYAPFYQGQLKNGLLQVYAGYTF